MAKSHHTGPCPCRYLIAVMDARKIITDPLVELAALSSCDDAEAFVTGWARRGAYQFEVASTRIDHFNAWKERRSQ